MFKLFTVGFFKVIDFQVILSIYRKFLTPVDKKNLFTVDHFPTWYRLAAENKPGQFFFYVPYDDINKGT